MCAPAPQGLFLLRWQTARGSLEGLLWTVLNVKNSEGQGHRPLQEVLGAGGPRGQCPPRAAGLPLPAQLPSSALGGQQVDKPVSWRTSWQPGGREQAEQSLGGKGPHGPRYSQETRAALPQVSR